MKIAKALLSVTAILAASSCASCAPVSNTAYSLQSPSNLTLEKVTFGQWTDCYRLTNGDVEVIVAPAVGRIVRYGRVGGANLLWLHPDPVTSASQIGGWVNWGGDKLWVWPQRLWKWPPPVELDGRPWRASVQGKKLELTSEICEPFGIRAHRTIELGDRGTTVSIQNSYEATRTMNDAISIWAVTQLDQPSLIRYQETSPATVLSAPDGSNVHDVTIVPNYREEIKTEINASRLAAVIGTEEFSEKVTQADDDRKPEAIASHAQIYHDSYTSPGQPAIGKCYAELELISSPKRLQKDQRLNFDIQWILK